MEGILSEIDFEKNGYLNLSSSTEKKQTKDLTYTLKACLYAGETFK